MKLPDMECHEAANIFPLDEDHIDDLAEDIRINGQQVAIELFDGKVLDGRRRLIACQRAVVKPKFRDVSPADPVAYVLSLNLQRRHLTPTQLAMVGARARETYDLLAKNRQRSSEGRGKKGPVNLPDLNGDARDAVGRAVGVSGKSIDHATKVLTRGTPKLIAAVDGDHLAVSTAAGISRLPAEAQDAEANRAEQNTRDGVPRRKRHAEVADDHHHEPTNGDIKRRGVGVILANEAINSLKRIPQNDALRKRGFQLVTDWIRRNK